MEIGRVYLLNPATAVGDKFNPARKVYETRVRVGVGVCVCVCSVVQSCPTLCGPMGLLGSSVHGIFLARILEWVSISFSRDLPNLESKPTSSCIGRQILSH